jgi:hypothetical protein
MSYELRGLGYMASGEGGLGYMASGEGGLGAEGVAARIDCPKSTSSQMPAGLSPQYLASYPTSSANLRMTNCNNGNAIARLCDQSAQPVLCYWGKTAQRPVKNYLGRAALPSDWEAWATWMPSGVSTDTAPGGGGGEAPMSDTTFYGLVALGALGVGAAVWYATRLQGDAHRDQRHRSHLRGGRRTRRKHPLLRPVWT